MRGMACGLRWIVCSAASAALLFGAAASAEEAEREPEQVEIVEDFSDGLARWEPLEADRWRVVEGEGDQPNALELTERGEQRGGVRRPGAYVLLKDHAFASVTLELEVRSLEADARRGRDVCLIFGHRDETHFHYAHLSDDADGKAHNVIMTVAGDKRFTIQQPARPEPRLTGDWTPMRLVVTAAGEVTVYMTDLETPLMTAKLDPATPGRVGLGAFNDRAAFRNLRITGTPR